MASGYAVLIRRAPFHQYRWSLGNTTTVKIGSRLIVLIEHAAGEIARPIPEREDDVRQL